MASADYDRRPADIRARQRNRKKKACQRCRTRKQRCDGKEPTCHNCATSGSECIPAKRDELALYPVAYINSLSQHVMNLESRQGQQKSHRNLASNTGLTSGLTYDVYVVPQENLEAPASQPSFSPPADRINNITAFNDPSLMDMNFMTAFPFQSPQNDNNDVQNPTFPGGFDLSLNLTPTRTSPGRRTTLSIPLTEAASHFQTYIDVIHPRYPVLTVEEYAQAYLVWKERGRSVDDFQKSWHLFVATMVRARLMPLILGQVVDMILQILGIGSRIHQPYNSRARRAQHEMLISHIESSDGEISDPDISPLSRLQAKLLNLIFVLLGDSTSRLVHVSGVVMRFATLHQFHRLEVSDQKDELDAKVRAWSCIYT
ncbi:hypothetical protein A1O3_00190 [Capronia epimyces CBS 606.96]|uniref:Zn(2)-C6 fungal-type domain-containing protein n=1 Tax=Capronia epimyces CBS 606.96 TaxID=1182542 RepID=W9YPN6_9EURO|nr:uncharacterized protein A1O3_00190 [Capronia epimyces CBS 606.96]EXJ91640.1 hypothetical protein A1O3_00190 [Capronia epimyces CBS 606.96]